MDMPKMRGKKYKHRGLHSMPQVRGTSSGTYK